MAAMRTGIADVLARLLDAVPGEDVSLSEILERLGGRGYGIAMFLLAAPNLTPGPSMPGFSTIFGLPMLALAVGMVLGWPSPRLPRLIGARRISRARLARMIGLMMPIAARADRVLRPRLPALAAANRVNGIAFAALAALLVLPFPFVSLAAGAAALLLAAGLLAEDGYAVALGHAGLVASLALYAAFAWLAYAALAAV
jgi:hypothetical protein